MGERNVPCVVINCGDDKGGHDDHHDDHKRKKDSNCCDSCDSVKSGNSSFVGGVDVGFITPVATEIPAELLINPVGSGKNVVVYLRAMSSIGSDDENVLFKFYFDPTVVVNGAPAAIVNLNQTPAAQPSAAQLWGAPTVSANGTLVDIFNTSSGSASSEATIVLGEGHSLLVTERANAENSRAAAFLYWKECRIKMPHEEEPEPTPG